MKRRSLNALALLSLTLPWRSFAAERIGVLMLHGKNPGSPSSPQYAPVRQALEGKGWLVAMPDMPWSRNRYLQGHWDDAMAEIAQQVKGLQDKGATRIVLMGHSMGVPAAMGHAARGGVVHALVLLAPGHVPQGYFSAPHLSAVGDSIRTARQRVLEGKGDATERFIDINQGRQIPVVTSARNFLSYFDPESDADMGVTAPKLPASLPVFTAIGEKDPLAKSVRRYYVDKLPPHPLTQFHEVAGGHLETPQVALAQVLDWIPQATAA